MQQKGPRLTRGKRRRYRLKRRRLLRRQRRRVPPSVVPARQRVAFHRFVANLDQAHINQLTQNRAGGVRPQPQLRGRQGAAFLRQQAQCRRRPPFALTCQLVSRSRGVRPGCLQRDITYSFGSHRRPRQPVGSLHQAADRQLGKSVAQTRHLQVAGYLRGLGAVLLDQVSQNRPLARRDRHDFHFCQAKQRSIEGLRLALEARRQHQRHGAKQRRQVVVADPARQMDPLPADLRPIANPRLDRLRVGESRNLHHVHDDALQPTPPRTAQKPVAGSQRHALRHRVAKGPAMRQLGVNRDFYERHESRYKSTAFSAALASGCSSKVEAQKKRARQGRSFLDLCV